MEYYQVDGKVWTRKTPQVRELAMAVLSDYCRYSPSGFYCNFCAGEIGDVALDFDPDKHHRACVTLTANSLLDKGIG